MARVSWRLPLAATELHNPNTSVVRCGEWSHRSIMETRLRSAGASCAVASPMNERQAVEPNRFDRLVFSLAPSASRRTALCAIAGAVAALAADVVGAAAQPQPASQHPTKQGRGSTRKKPRRHKRCAPGQTRCPAGHRKHGCVDLQTDPAHCHDCSHSCASDESCVGGTCVPACAPQCDGKQCGDDRCGGSCGDCATGLICAAGACVVGQGTCAAGANVCSVQTDRPTCNGTADCVCQTTLAGETRCTGQLGIGGCCATDAECLADHPDTPGAVCVDRSTDFCTSGCTVGECFAPCSQTG